MSEIVLVTGGSGFIGSHCIIQLLAAGYEVRTTVRKLEREPEVRAMLREGGAEPADRLRFFAADLEHDAGWREAVGGCDYVLHVASPFPASSPKHEDDLIRPAREGALRVLRAARDSGVKRVVLTSSFAAIGYGHGPRSQAFDETSWTVTDGDDVSPYAKSKTLAERAAWAFVEKDGNGLELAVVNPVAVFGPTLAADYSTSILIVQKMLDGEMPGAPQISFGVVDVRDVADLHLRAMTHPAAKGERFLATSGDFMSLLEIAKTLRSQVPALAKKAPKFELPNFIVRVGALFDSSLGLVTPELGRHKNATGAKAERLLGWQPRSREDALVATAESLLRLGLVKASAKLGHPVRAS